jgi:imidazole glycerol-phosphate synthase subunit HisF
MANVRLIARLDIKAPNLIKGIHLEGLRVVGDPAEYALRYYAEGADELLYMDIVASLYQRNHLASLVRYTAENVFIPLTVGGGIRSIDDVAALLREGADKVAVNTAATQRPELLYEISRRFGSQCTVLGIEAKKRAHGTWEAFTDNGREPTGLDVVEWAKRGEQMGAGEILLTSIDQEGTRKGFDVELCHAVSTQVSVPVILSGGMGNSEHLLQAADEGKADAMAMADVIHYERIGFAEMKNAMAAAGQNVRHTPGAEISHSAGEQHVV